MSEDKVYHAGFNELERALHYTTTTKDRASNIFLIDNFTDNMLSPLGIEWVVESVGQHPELFIVPTRKFENARVEYEVIEKREWRPGYPGGFYPVLKFSEVQVPPKYAMQFSEVVFSEANKERLKAFGFKKVEQKNFIPKRHKV